MKHVTSLPKFFKSNGIVERAIGTMKTLMSKVLEDVGDTEFGFD